MHIRRASSDDLPAIAALHRESILELCKTHYDARQLAAWTAALQPEAYATLLATRELWVAEDGPLLGFGVLDVSEGLINATYVLPTAKGRGVGRQLLAALEHRARTAGRHRVSLHATLNAARFYERLGYASLGATTNRFPNGTELPCLEMSKTLHAQC